MRCASCDTDNPPGTLACRRCAAPLAAEGLPCPGCGAQTSASSRFCGACGAPLPVSGAPTVGDGRYEIGRLLGEGSRKRVFLGYDRRLDRQVAIALIETGGLDASTLARVRSEARALGKLSDHPNIVTVHDTGEEPGRVFVVSQLMAGGDVQQYLERFPGRRLPLGDALRIAEQSAGRSPTPIATASSTGT